MATPTSARFSAGASLTPSPVMATTAPSACSASTRRSLCSGLVRAKTVASRATRRRPPWSRPSSSGPVTAFGSWARPSWRAMASAVATWSPVIILIPIPAARQSRTAAIASVRGGSISPSSPRKTRPPSISPMTSRAGSPGMVRVATASTRWPPAARLSTAWCQKAGSRATVAGGRALHPTHVEQALGCTLDVDQGLAADRVGAASPCSGAGHRTGPRRPAGTAPEPWRSGGPPWRRARRAHLPSGRPRSPSLRPSAGDCASLQSSAAKAISPRIGSPAGSMAPCGA